MSTTTEATPIETGRKARKQRLRRAGLPVSAAIALTVVAIMISGGRTGGLTGATPAQAAAEMQTALAGIPQSGLTLGNASAPVTVTEFADLQCPYCDEYTLTQFPGLVARYVVPGKIKMVFRDLSFLGPDSLVAGRAAAAAGDQNKLWSFVDAFYYQQGPENSGYVTAAFLRKVGATVPGLDVNRMMVERQLPAANAELRSATALAREAHVTGTPAFLIERSGLRPVRIIGSGELEKALRAVVAGR